MSYRDYVTAAYVVFVAVMLWEWLAPWAQIRQRQRAARLRRARASSHDAGAPPARE